MEHISSNYALWDLSKTGIIVSTKADRKKQKATRT